MVSKIFVVDFFRKSFYKFLEETPQGSKVSIFQIEYYQQFFNIDTIEVVNRIATSMIYKRAHSNYLRNNLGEFNHLPHLN